MRHLISKRSGRPLVESQQGSARPILLKRSALRLPTIDCLGERVVSELSSTAQRLSYVRSLGKIHNHRVPPHWIERFSHSLSDHFCRANDQRPVFSRSPKEKRALRSWTLSAEDLLSNENFLGALKRLNCLLLNRDSAFRSSDICTNTNHYGAAIVFPSLREIGHQIEWLRVSIQQNLHPGLQLFTAFLALPILTNSHLFLDGNGRASRVVFNHLLHRMGVCQDAYFPLYEVMVASRGGFIIRLRQAEVQDQWGPFVLYMLNFMEYCIEQGQFENADG